MKKKTEIHSSRCACGWFKQSDALLCSRCSVLLLDPVVLLQPEPGPFVHLPVKRFKNRMLKGPELPLRWLSRCGLPGYLYLNAPILEERRLCRDCKMTAVTA